MQARERIINSINFRSTDVVPLRIYAAAGGLYEHGEKLLELIKECGDDFGEFNDLTLPEPPPVEDFDADGSYHAIKTDDWGTTWEYRIFGIWGHPIAWPLENMADLDDYAIPTTPTMSDAEFEKAKIEAEIHKQKYFLLGGGGGIFEKMHSLRRFEDVLMDITLDTPEINKLADMIMEGVAVQVSHSLALDVDGVTFGDDFGTETSLLLSPDTWRTFFKPRYKALMEPVVRAGKKVFFHCCGQVSELLEEFREVGVDVIWPQLPVYDLPELSTRCRDLGLALELHPDRGEMMQNGTPEDVKNYVRNLVDTFDPLSGGSWLYIEIDPGFPWRNVEALFEIAMELRKKSRTSPQASEVYTQ